MSRHEPSTDTGLLHRRKVNRRTDCIRLPDVTALTAVPHYGNILQPGRRSQLELRVRNIVHGRTHSLVAAPYATTEFSPLEIPIMVAFLSEFY